MNYKLSLVKADLFLINDLIEELLSHGDSPSKAGFFITDKIRELIGARIVLLFQKSSLTGQSYKLISASPKRKRDEIDIRTLNKLIKNFKELKKITIINPKVRTGSNSSAAALLRKMKLSDSIIIPLEAENENIGYLLLLDLITTEGTERVCDAIGKLSGVLALILKNAVLFQDIEKIVETRTEELSRINIQLKAKIKEKNKAERKLISSEKALAEKLDEINYIYNVSPVGLCIVDTDLRFIRINQKLAEINGPSISEHLGKSVAEVLPALAPKLVPLYNKVLESGKPVLNTEIEGTTQAEPDAIKFWRVSYYPIISEKGKTFGVGTIVNDISELKRTEKELIASRQFFKDISTSMSDWIWEVDKEGRYTYCSENVKHVLGYSPNEIIGKTPFDFMHPEESEKVKKLFSEIVNQKKVIVDLENWNISKDGEVVCLLTNGIPLLDSKGNLTGYRGVDNNITIRKKEEELYRTMYESSRDAIMIISPASWKFTSCNAATVAMFRARDEKDFISREFWDFSPKFQPGRIPTAVRAEELMKETLEKGSSFFEWTHKRLNGDEFPATILLTCIRLNNEDFLQATVRDITVNKNLEQILEKQTFDLGERVKELTCLHDITLLVERPNITLEGIYQGTVDFMKSAWQYPEITSVRLIIEKKEYKSYYFSSSEWKQETDIKFLGKRLGSLQVYYSEEKSIVDEGPFLKEERYLLNTIAERLGRIIERKKADELILSEQTFSKDIIQGIPGLFYIFDENGKFVTRNDNWSNVIGFSSKELDKMTAFDVVADRDLCVERVKEVFDKGISSMENFLLTKKGEKIAYSFTGKLMVIDKKNYLVGVGMDISMRYKYARDLEKTNIELEKTHEHAMYMLALASEYKDPETGEHIKRIIKLTSDIAMEMGIKPEQAEQIGKDSNLHDLGKLGISDYILLKPNKLSEDEFNIMKKHTLIGAKIIGEDKWFVQARQIALSHHEQWNGKGYPEGLKGNKIPIAARIVAVSDTYDALISRRPYKDPWSREEAVAEIKKDSGSHFDPEVVKAFLSLNKKGRLK